MDLDAIDNVTRTSRDEEQHDKKARRKPWQPARMLETPPAPEVINTVGLGQSM